MKKPKKPPEMDVVNVPVVLAYLEVQLESIEFTIRKIETHGMGDAKYWATQNLGYWRHAHSYVRHLISTLTARSKKRA